MKKIYLKHPPSTLYANNGIFRINNGHNIFWNIDRELSSKDICIKTLDNDKKNDGDLYIFSDVPYPWRIKEWAKTLVTRKRNILFCFESPIVNPFSHIKTLHHFFRKVYTWDDELVDNKKYFKFFIPQLPNGLNTRIIDFQKRKFLTLINAKKDTPLLFSLLSPYKKNLYKKRMQAINFFSDQIPKAFDLYGKGWDKPIPWDLKERLFGAKQYETYKGELKSDKIEKLSHYKFCLCFENTEAPGYITEKIFDCLKARCVPIYKGAPDVVKYIPKECFIDARQFNNFKTVLDFLNNIDEKTFMRYIMDMELFLSNQRVRKTWFEKLFQSILVRESKME